MEMREKLDQAAQDDGVCLCCEQVVEFVERRLILGLCPNCGEQEVVSVELAKRVLETFEE